MGVYLGSNKVGVTKELGNDMLQWKCDNMKKLNSEFSGYKGTEPPILKGLNTSNVTDMSGMFYNCSGLKNLDLSNFDTINVTTMSQMFRGCSGLKSLYLPQFYKHNLKYIDNMFYGCSVLESIDLSNPDTSGVTSMSYLFSGCNALKSLDITNFNTSNVTSMNQMFSGCMELETINVINFNTSKVKDMSFMFNHCQKLKNLDLSNFDTTKVTNMGSMFQACRVLETITNIDMRSITSSTTELINQCYELKNLMVYNVKKNLVIGKTQSTSNYGYNLTLDSLVHTIQELWDLTESTSQTLTMSTPSKELIANVYVKLVDITDDMIAQDENIIYKKPCVVCESTDEGAMTITEYATSKNWAIA